MRRQRLVARLVGGRLLPVAVRFVLAYRRAARGEHAHVISGRSVRRRRRVATCRQSPRHIDDVTSGVDDRRDARGRGVSRGRPECPVLRQQLPGRVLAERDPAVRTQLRRFSGAHFRSALRKRVGHDRDGVRRRPPVFRVAVVAGDRRLPLRAVRQRVPALGRRSAGAGRIAAAGRVLPAVAAAVCPRRVRLVLDVRQQQRRRRRR